MLGRKENCLLLILKERKVLFASTLARSSNNVSLISLEYFFSFWLPYFCKSIVFSFTIQCNNNKEGVPKQVGGDLCYVYTRGFCAVQLAVDKRRYKRVSDTTSNWFANHRPQLRTQMSTVTNDPFHSKLESNGLLQYSMQHPSSASLGSADAKNRLDVSGISLRFVDL